jgi:hypothetical protein
MLVIFETVKFRIAIIAAFISCAPLIYANPVEAFWGNESRKILGTWECKSTIKANQLTIYTDGQYAFSNDGQLNANGLIVYSHSNGPRIKYRTNSRGKWSVSGSNMEMTSTYMDSRNISNPPSDFKHGPWVWRAFLDDEFGHKDAYINSKGITTYLKILEINANNFVTRSSKGVLNTCTR